MSNGHAQTGTLDLGTNYSLSTSKRLKDVLQEHRRHTHSIVSHLKSEAGNRRRVHILFSHRKTDIATHLGIFHRIGQQIEQDLV